MRRIYLLLACFACLGASTRCASPVAVCSGDVLADQLTAATAGQVVTAPACTVRGSFRVPPGVKLRGVTGSVIHGTGDHAVTLVTGLAPTFLDNIVIESEGKIGVLVEGASRAVVSNVTVRATRGLAIAARDATLELTDTTLVGPVVGDGSDSKYLRVAAAAPPVSECPSAPCECAPGSADGERVCAADGKWSTLTATVGLAVHGGMLTAVRLTVSRFAEYGVALESAQATFQGLGVQEILGTGVYVNSGTVTFAQGSISRTLQGVRGFPSFGLIVVGDAVVTTADLHVSDNARYGYVQVGGAAQHVRMTGESNKDAAVWVSNVSQFALMGSSRFMNNTFAGIVVSNSRDVTIDGAMVGGTAMSRRPVGTGGVIEVGDGLHLRDAATNVRFANMTLVNNARAGFVANLVGGMTGSFEAVSVESTGTSLGAIAGTLDGAGRQIQAVQGGWDTGIVRRGAAASNDSAFTGRLDSVAANMMDGVRSARESIAVVFPMF